MTFNLKHVLGVLKRYWFIVLIILLRLPSLFEPYWYGDEAIYLTIGQSLRRGVELYSGIHDNKPPFLYYFAALSPSVFAFRFLLLAWMIPTYYVFYRFLKLLKTPSGLTNLVFGVFIILTSIPLLEGNIANAEIFMLLPTMAAYYLFLKLPDANKYKYLLIGLLFGFSFCIKIPVAIEMAFLGLFILFDRIIIKRQPKKAITQALGLAFGFLIIPLILVVKFYLSGDLILFLSSAFDQNLSYLSSWSTGNQKSSALAGGLGLRLAITMALWIAALFTYFRTKHQSMLIWGWFVAALCGALLSGRPYPHYLVLVLPPMMLLLALSFKSIPGRIILFISVLLLAFSIVKYKFYFYPVFTYYQNFYQRAVGLRSLSDYRQFFGYQVNSTYETSAFIQNNTLPSDKIFVWGDDPYIYPLSKRLPVGRYTVAYHIRDFNQYQPTLSALQLNLPKYIVVSTSMDDFAELQSFVQRYYYLDQFYSPYLIYKIR